MNRVFVDQNGFDFRFLTTEPRYKYLNGKVTDEPETDAEGNPLASLICLAKPVGANKPETITVKIPAAGITSSLEEFDKIAFANLSAYAYASGDRAQLSFSADKVGKLKA